ncbi:uncharacterized protein CTRU02_206652 [Colletotrichum truncatum]|uniref:Uncharacterized protein n=1 Tax=Colletotrichum truncatum TaxID=5467 RepID=A0ACC3Z7E8_COLTU|nr:uncharacterized protein CTRU02_13773 [Colletotrichum truncatum]KAF6782947.1 hypothetical protein CTRU02_13773 [Colletotrichum truncatum]
MTTPNPHVSPPEHYGGLEVDTRQTAGGGWNSDDFTKFRVTNQNPSNLPQVYSPELPEVAPYQGRDASMPQAVDPAYSGAGAGTGASAAAAPAAAVYDSGYYAPKAPHEEAVIEEIKEPKVRTICGMRRKVFWIVLVVALIVVIGAGVGGGVGGALAAQNSAQDGSLGGSSTGGSGSNGDSGSGSGSGSGNGGGSSGGSGGSGNSSDSTSQGAILPASNIGSLNFTDLYGFENHMVFYQLRTKQVWQSFWNSSTKVWTSADAKVGDTVKEGTPISNSLFWHSNSSRDIRIYYLNEKNQVMGQINANPVYGLTWDKSGVSEQFTAAASSQLLSNGQYSADSYLSNLVLYQDSGSTLRVLRRTGGNTDWVATGISTSFGKPADGTGLSFIPVYTTERTKKMNLFYVSDSGSLVGLTLTNNNDWSGETLPTTVETNSSITAFSSGYNNTDLTIHVLATQTGKAPVLTTYSDGKWKNEGEIETMSGDDRPIKISANLGGRVYGIVERSSNKVEIVEWEWTGGTSYNKIGVVDVVT